MRIGILLTDNDTSEYTKSHPDDAEKFRRLLSKIRPDWDYITYSAKDEVLPGKPAECDGYVITGSPASVHDGYAWVANLLEFIRQTIELKIPMIGCCFGHQAIAAALGGQVDRNRGGWGLGVTPTTYEVHLAWMTPEYERLNFYCAHNEQVSILPEGATVIGYDPMCRNSGFVIGNHVFTTQHHPEMTPDYVKDLLDNLENLIDEPAMTKARESVIGGAEGDKFAQWMINFFEMKR